MFFICGAAVGQGAPSGANEEWPVPRSPGCSAQNRTPLSGLKLYVDKVDGFQFKYPSALKTDESWLGFVNGPCVDFLHRGETIRLEVTLPASYQKPFLAQEALTSVDTQVFNQLTWMNYSAPSSATYCTFWKGEQVCIYGGAIPAHGPLSDGVVKAMREIESTFVFSLSDRMDSKIALVKVGDRFGSLRVKRVVTREMAERNPRGSYAGFHVSYGEIDFTGSVTMVGGFEDLRTMNSGPNWIFSPDAEPSSLLSCDLCKGLHFQIQFRNQDFETEQNDRIKSHRFGSIAYDDNTEFTVVANKISIVFSPGDSPSLVRADLVRISENR